ncbi:MAG: agmatinase family protein [Deltaproteobacteria bacterium]|nr:agmatinase family protein [Deltaproteobacteria bacterium]
MSFDPDAPAAGGNLYGLPVPEGGARVQVQAVPWQATTSYRRGTIDGPAALAAASLQVDLHDAEYGDAWREGIELLPEDPRFREWDAEAEPHALRVIASLGHDPAAAALVNQLSERVNEAVHARARAIVGAGHIPALIGGDHSTPFGAIRAVAEAFPGVGVLHVDAHADLRVAYEGFAHSHASIMYNVHRYIADVSGIVQVGIRDVGAAEVALIHDTGSRISTWFDADVAMRLAEGEPWADIVDELIAALPDRVYVSFDVDGLDPALCPGTGTPVPGGLSYRDACVLLRRLSAARQIVGFDLNEIGPGEWDGNVSARMLYKLFGAAVCSHPRR